MRRMLMIVLAFAAIAAVILAVHRYRIVSLDATQWIILLLVIGIVSLFVYFQITTSENDYNFLDTLKGSDGKTSIGAHFAWGLYVAALWLIIRHGVDDPTETWPWVRDALLISLGYRLGAQGIEAVSKKPPSPPSPVGAAETVNINQPVTNQNSGLPPAIRSGA